VGLDRRIGPRLMPVVSKHDDPTPEKPAADPAIVQIGGIDFVLREKPSPMALLQYAKAAIDGTTTRTVEGQAQTVNFFEGVFDPDEFARFSRHCRRANIDFDTLVEIVGDVYAHYMDRPTTSSSDSSTSSGSVEPSTEGDSSEKASSAPGKKRRAT
jgi:hypothetical protein